MNATPQLLAKAIELGFKTLAPPRDHNFLQQHFENVLYRDVNSRSKLFNHPYLHWRKAKGYSIESFLHTAHQFWTAIMLAHETKISATFGSRGIVYCITYHPFETWKTGAASRRQRKIPPPPRSANENTPYWNHSAVGSNKPVLQSYWMLHVYQERKYTPWGSIYIMLLPWQTPVIVCLLPCS